MIRHLAAVLAADIVGYARLMGEDEARTLAALRQLRAELFDPVVAGHRGKIVKRMGDGWLVEFASAVDAVNCALQAQERLAGHNLIKLRIGIHVGDIVHEDEDIFGDGVNVAARLQEIAAPGGVAISDPTYSSLDGTLTPAFVDAGAQQLKNISRPLQVWKQVQGSGGAAPGVLFGPPRRSFAWPVVAIRPVNCSDDRPAVRELANALTNDLATYLLSPDWLDAVIVRQPDMQGYVVQASLRSQGSQLRLEISLTTAAGRQLWATKFDGSLDDSFAWQDSVAEQAAAALVGQIGESERQRLAAIPHAEMSGPELLLHDSMQMSDYDAEGLAAAVDSFARAIVALPDLPVAYGWATVSLIVARSSGHEEAVAAYLPQFEAWRKEAERLSPAGSFFASIGEIMRRLTDRDAEGLRLLVDHCLSQTPFDLNILEAGGWSHLWLGEPDAALDYLQKGQRLGAFNWRAPALITGVAIAHIQNGHDELALQCAKRAIAKAPRYIGPYNALAAACAHLGREAEAVAAMDTARQLNPALSLSEIRNRGFYVDTPATRRFFDGLRLAGLPE